MSLRARGWSPGLGGRLTIALVAVSVATLVAALASIVPLLTRHLERERVSELRVLARTARPDLRAIPRRDLEPNSRALVRFVGRLQDRTGGRIALYDATGRPLADTARAAARVSVPDLAARSREAGRRPDRLVAGRRGTRAYVVTRVRDGREALTLVLTKRLDDSHAVAAVLRRRLPIALAIGLAVSLALALLISHGLLARLRRLSGDARGLAEEGLSREVAVEGDDEVAEVAGALERMRVRLVEEERARQRFVASASHELRTPLASLQATLELLREEVLAGGMGREAVDARTETALRQTRRLVGLATDLLDLGRLDAEGALAVEPIDVRELADAIAPEFTAVLGAEGRTLDVEGPPVLAAGDAVAIARVLRILLENAGTHGAGRVRVTVARSPGGGATVSVADAGPGVPAEERDLVFERFARGAGSKGAPGAGLGLAIARGLAQAMGGDLTLADRGRGACFVLALAPPPGAPAREGPPGGAHVDPITTGA